MAVTDQNLLNEMQMHSLETVDLGVTWKSDTWATAEVCGYMNDRARRFHYFTNLDLVISSVASVIDQAQYDILSASGFNLPNTISIYRIAWVRTSDGKSFELQRMDHMPHDFLNPTVTTSTTPWGYTVTLEPTMTLTVIPAPHVAGTFTFIHDEIDTAMDGSGVTVGAVDEVAPYFKWGALADMLKKDGPANDMNRSQYCEQRYQEGIDLADLLVRGWS